MKSGIQQTRCCYWFKAFLSYHAIIDHFSNPSHVTEEETSLERSNLPKVVAKFQ